MQGLTVQGVSPTRLTPRPNEDITVPDEVGRAITARLLVRKLIEPRTVIAMGGLGPQPEVLTVSDHVRAAITRAALVRMVADIQSRYSTPKPAHPSEYDWTKDAPVVEVVTTDGLDSAGYDASVPASIEVELS